jgi:hypothetical protein
MRRIRVTTALALGALLLAVGCKILAPAPPAPVVAPKLADCPGTLVPTQELEGDWVIQERARIFGPRVDESYALVLKRGPSLVLVGLTQYGAKAFAVTQVGLRTYPESFLGPALPVPPENVLRDLHRAHFLASESPDFEGRVVERGRDGGTRIKSAACGYDATYVPIQVTAPGSSR